VNKRTVGRSSALILSTILLLAVVTAGKAWWWNSDDKPEATEVTEVYWEDLVPEDFVPVQDPLVEMTREEIDKLFDGSEESNKQIEEIQEMMAYAPIVPELNNQRVKIPGYIVPLDFDGQTELSEFLLVPYYGACIHTPPPPANQVVHAISESTVTVENTYNPVWAVGTLKTQTVHSNLAEAGYKIDIEFIEPYTEPEANK
jgi:hypothetical protein